MNLNIPSITTKISSNFLHKKEVEIFIKRDDLIHKIISGNKWRKLKYNFKEAKEQGYNTVLSFGRSYSNHLHALSYAAKKHGLNSVGVVRGNKIHYNSTLSFCSEQNMKLESLDRLSYRSDKYSKRTINKLIKKFGRFYMIPEGGNNILGVKGCEEIIKEVDNSFDYVCSSVGTGCTASGLIRSIKKKQNFLGFSPFKKVHEQRGNILQFCDSKLYDNWQLIPDNHFGGFGKINSNLITFANQFNLKHNIQLDLVYMSKLFYSLFDLISKDFFSKKTTILVIHTGGNQGSDGFKLNY